MYFYKKIIAVKLQYTAEIQLFIKEYYEKKYNTISIE